jgi:hypothetical protein
LQWKRRSRALPVVSQIVAGTSATIFGRGKAKRAPVRVGSCGEIRFAEGLSQRVALTTVRITRSYAIRVFGQLSVCAALEVVSALWRRTSRRQGDTDNRPAKLMRWQSLLRTTVGATRFRSQVRHLTYELVLQRVKMLGLDFLILVQIKFDHPLVVWRCDT